MRIIRLADYTSPVPGSFVAGLQAVFGIVERRGWTAELGRVITIR